MRKKKDPLVSKPSYLIYNYRLKAKERQNRKVTEPQALFTYQTNDSTWIRLNEKNKTGYKYLKTSLVFHVELIPTMLLVGLYDFLTQLVRREKFLGNWFYLTGRPLFEWIKDL